MPKGKPRTPLAFRIFSKAFTDVLIHMTREERGYFLVNLAIRWAEMMEHDERYSVMLWNCARGRPPFKTLENLT